MKQNDHSVFMISPSICGIMSQCWIAEYRGLSASTVSVAGHTLTQDVNSEV